MAIRSLETARDFTIDRAVDGVISALLHATAQRTASSG
jgi:hypothetical protein